MSNVFYRKHRPLRFEDLIGQNHLKNILVTSIKINKTSHAYLFCGPRGTGKTTTARIMAKALNCLNFEKNNDVCNECENCLLINEGSAVDITEMDAASNRGIDEVRSLKDSVNYLPTNLKKKVYIIDEAHMITTPAFNALLKTLEEPPAHVTFILATTEPHKIPVTILSRVQRYDFSLGTQSQVTEKLSKISESEGIDVDNEVLDYVFKFTGGSFRDAESLFNKLVQNSSSKKIKFDDIKELLGIVDKDILKKFSSELINLNSKQSLKTFEKISENISEYNVFIDQFINFLTDEILENLQNKILVSKYKNIISNFIDIKPLLKEFVNQKSLIEYAIVKICTNNDSFENFNKSNNPIEPKVNNGSNQDLHSLNESEKKSDANVDQQDEGTYSNSAEISNIIESNNSKSEKDDILQKAVIKLSEVDKRASLFLSQSIISIEGLLVTIINNSSFNISILSKEHTMRDLNKIFSEIMGLENIQIKFVVSNNITSNNSDNSIQLIHSQQLEKNEPILNQIEDSTKPEIDNSELIESIL